VSCEEDEEAVYGRHDVYRGVDIGGVSSLEERWTVMANRVREQLDEF
jgi:hypothetical protein